MEMMQNLLIYVVTGLVAGFSGGLLGVGGGIIMVPVFYYILKIPMHVSVGSSLAVIIFTSIAGSYKHYILNNVNIKLVLAVAVFSIIGSYLGALVCEKVSADLLRKIFAVILMLTAIKMLFK
jgi:uncharacterized membrane protein YfcA